MQAIRIGNAIYPVGVYLCDDGMYNDPGLLTAFSIDINQNRRYEIYAFVAGSGVPTTRQMASLIWNAISFVINRKRALRFAMNSVMTVRNVDDVINTVQQQTRISEGYHAASDFSKVAIPGRLYETDIVNV